MNPDHALLSRWSAPVSMAGCSPLAARLAMTALHVDRTLGVVRLGFTPSAADRTVDGSPAPPLVAAMLDFALGFSALATIDPPDSIVTSTLRLEQVATSDAASFEVEGTVVGANDTTIFSRAELRDDRGLLVALASATQPRMFPGR